MKIPILNKGGVEKKCLVLSNLGNIYNSDNHKFDSYVILGKWMSLIPPEIKNKEIIFSKPNEENPSDLIKQHQDISGIYKSLLIQLANILNEYHSEDMSVRQWEIIIGPWLKLYIDSLFVRWKLLLSALDKEPKTVFILDIKGLKKIPTPGSRDDFANLLTNNIFWNQFILSEAFMSMREDSDLIVVSNVADLVSHEFLDEGVSLLDRLEYFFKNRIKSLIGFGLRLLPTKNSIVINTPYISIKNQLKLSFELRGFPLIHFSEKYQSNQLHVDLSEREVLKTIQNDSSDSFSEFVGRMVQSQLPRCYFEEWENLKRQKDRLNLPEKTKLIYTGSGSASDECFRLYIAEQVGLGTRYVISQHGGVYGVSLIPPKAEFYEHRVADRWVSWGWSYSDNKIFRGLNTKMLSNTHICKGYGETLLLALPLVEESPSRIVYSDPDKILNVHLSVLDELDSRVASATIIRPAPSQRNKSYLERFPQKFNFSYRNSFWKDMNQSKLFLCTSNSTTLLEALAANFPTIILLENTEGLIRPEAQDYFNELEKVGVLFKDSVLAAKHINMIWTNVDSWWLSNDVQSARGTFCKQYSNLMVNDTKYFANCIGV